MTLQREEIYYDERAHRLVFLGSNATPEFWDAQWTEKRDPGRYRTVKTRGLVPRYTKKYLREPAVVLEGGCGLAQESWALAQLGYRPIALDFATTTIDYLKEHVPEVNPIQGDVRALPFEAASIDGYWSIGVIEHFYDGYEAIRDEMARVIRPGGFLFLTFPHMSRLRLARARLGLYPPWRVSSEGLQRFYQFALDQRRVRRDFEAHGFVLRETVRSLGLTGLGRDLPNLVGPAVTRLVSSKARPHRWAAAAVERVVRPFSSHTVLLVFERTR